MKTHVTVDGVKLAFEVTGRPGATPLILLHGAGSGGEIWHRVAPVLAETHRVYALDQRGFGESDWPGVYGFEIMRDDVVAFADVLGLRGFGLIGHSMGGTVAWLVAQQLGARVTHLVVVDSPPPKRSPFRIDPGERPEGDLPFDWAARSAIIEEFNHAKQEWWDDTRKVTARTLIVAGGESSHVPQDWLREAVELVPNGTLVEIPVGHGVHVDAPEEFAAVTQKFLRTV